MLFILGPLGSPKWDIADSRLPLDLARVCVGDEITLSLELADNHSEYVSVRVTHRGWIPNKSGRYELHVCAELTSEHAMAVVDQPKNALADLTFRERSTVQALHGLRGHPQYTVVELASYWQVSPDHVRALANRAYIKLGKMKLLELATQPLAKTPCQGKQFSPASATPHAPAPADSPSSPPPAPPLNPP